MGLSQESSRTKLQTGIHGLDRELAGGIEAGSLVSVIAGPATQSEHLFQQTLGLRPTLYLSALRESQAVRESLGTVEDVFVEDLQQTSRMDKEAVKELTGSRGYSSPITNGDERLDAVYEMLEKIDRQMNIILDPVNPLEETESADTYREVINKYKSKVLETNSLGILHCITLEEAPPLRDITLAISDVVVELELVAATNEMQYQLTIPKNRGGEPLLNETEVIFESDVRIDETRNI
jgi:archaellum biogenesis ATPase FlaH